MNNLWLKAGLIASLSVSGLAFAQSSSTSAPAMSGTSTTQSSAVAPQTALSRIGVSTLSWFYGPYVNNLKENTVTDDSVDSVKGLDSRHQLTVKYNISDKMSIGPVLDFLWSFTDKEGKNDNTFAWKDSFIKFKHSDLYSANIGGNDISVAGDLRYFVPSSKNSRTSNNYGGMRLSLNPSIQFGKSPFSISTVNYSRVWFQTQTNNPAGSSLPLLELYTGPQINYQVNDAVTAFVLYEADLVYNNNGVPNSRDVKKSQPSLADVEPGVDIKLHDRVTLSPYLNWFTNQRLSTTTVNLAASFTLL
jgi:hypothetical protein